MTEKHENAERVAIMQEKGCSELEAVFHMAERITRPAWRIVSASMQMSALRGLSGGWFSLAWIPIGDNSPKDF
jgi:hypothetical protein